MVMRLVLAALLSAGLAACGGGGGGTADGNISGRQWTYMVYMGADNNLSEAGVGDINEMETVGSNANVAIVVQAEFSAQYSAGLGRPTDTQRIYVQNDGNTNNVNLTGVSIGNVDMGKPAALTDFINWAKATYPAQHYALVIWDHGAGWKTRELTNPLRGAVQDETSGSFMTLPDLAKAVSDSGTHMDIVNFDACLMAMYEVAYEFRGLTDYMVFSEETEPGAGDPYDTILTALKQNPTMSSRTLASTIVDKYQAYYIPNTRESTTKSAIDMAQIDALDAKIVALANALDASTNAVVAAAQTNTQKYTYESNHDLFHFCQYLNANLTSGTAKTICGEIVAMKGSVVVNSKTTGSSMANSQGLAIYIPTAAQTNATDLGKYGLLKCNLTTRASAAGTWGSYVAGFTGNGTGGYATSEGNFGVYIYWTKPDGVSACDADLDLYVNEADGTWYSPWMGQTSPNGFFSQDSTDSGESGEYYVANASVMLGTYDALINYYADGASCNQALVHMLVLDPKNGINSYTEVAGSPVYLDLSNEYTTGCTDPGYFACLNTHSDWWWPWQTTRQFNGGALNGNQELPNAGKSINPVFKQKKNLPSRLNK